MTSIVATVTKRRGTPVEHASTGLAVVLGGRTFAARWFSALLGCALGALPCACDDDDTESRGAAACAPGSPAVDPALLAYLSGARAAHHEADLHEDSHDLQTAIRVLLRVVAQTSAAIDRPEIAEVMADTYARLAELKSQLGEFDAAESDIRSGLALAETPTYFRGHLWEIRGLVEQRRFRKLSDDGDGKGAAVAKQRAIEAFEEAMRVQQVVIRNVARRLPAPSANRQP